MTYDNLERLAQIEKVGKMYAEDLMTIPEIATELSLHDYMVRTFIFLAGHEIRGKKNQCTLWDRKKEQFAKLVEEGWSNPFIAAKLGISVFTVTRYRKRLKEEEGA